MYYVIYIYMQFNYIYNEYIDDYYEWICISNKLYNNYILLLITPNFQIFMLYYPRLDNVG